MPSIQAFNSVLIKRYATLGKRAAGVASADVRNQAQLRHCYAIEINAVVFKLIGRLSAHD